MIELHLKRIAKRPTYTIGRLSVRRREPGKTARWTYFCDTLEPHWVDFHHGGRKTKGKTAIPEGRYPVVVTMSPKFHRWLPPARRRAPLRRHPHPQRQHRPGHRGLIIVHLVRCFGNIETGLVFGKIVMRFGDIETNFYILLLRNPNNNLKFAVLWHI